ncbi:helix-turn-helix domain-containing protein [Haladaptatus sp. DYF46]|uniref:winged helix-turn-helix transcriptional regulator n=1 Tax=Haladaptatus sp. DYF46 TaxID=2886041 RepID=UPI001E4A3C8A|nr:helix-turn-helix domain-containing protein [Haladaptatus sp. DYF46]
MSDDDFPDPEAVLERGRRYRAKLDEYGEAKEKETITELFTLLGRAYALPVLHTFSWSDEPLRFSDLEDHLDVSPTTLSKRLSELTEAGLLTRRSYDEIPPRVEYEPTAAADDLAPVFIHLYEWASVHDLDGEE